MAAKGSTISFRAPQSGRPDPRTGAAAQRDSERALAGALSVPIEQVIPDPDQPRKTFDQKKRAEMAASIREHGIMTPLLVRESGVLADGRTQYMIIAGERRYQGGQDAGEARLPVLVKDSEGYTIRVLQLLENLQREQLPPVDEARAFKELIEQGGYSTRTLAEKLGVDHSTIAARLKLLTDEDVATAVMDQSIKKSTAERIVREKDTGRRKELLDQAKRHHLGAKDIIRLRGELAAAADRPPVERTLREVAHDMGATEDEIAVAALSRKEDPELTAPEALTLAMSIPYEKQPRGAQGEPRGAAPGAAGVPGGRLDAHQFNRELADRLLAVGGGAGLSSVLSWAVGEGLDVGGLIQRLEGLITVLAWADEQGVALAGLRARIAPR